MTQISGIIPRLDSHNRVPVIRQEAAARDYNKCLHTEINVEGTKIYYLYVTIVFRES